MTTTCGTEWTPCPERKAEGIMSRVTGGHVIWYLVTQSIKDESMKQIRILCSNAHKRCLRGKANQAVRPSVYVLCCQKDSVWGFLSESMFPVSVQLKQLWNCYDGNRTWRSQTSLYVLEPHNTLCFVCLFVLHSVIETDASEVRGSLQ